MYACKLSIIKYIADPIKDEPINIGVILHCPSLMSIECKFTERQKISKIKTLYPDINIKFLENLITDFELMYNSERHGCFNNLNKQLANPNFLNSLAQKHSNQLRITPAKGVLVNDFNVDMIVMFNQYVGIEEKQVNRKPVLDKTIKKTLKKEFLDRKILEKTIFTDAIIQGVYGEDISFDFRYLNGRANYIHTISFDVNEKDINDAKIWAMNYKETKQMLNNNVAITTVYCPPQDDLKLVEFDKSLKILRSTTDTIVNFESNKDMVKFYDHIIKNAHN